MRVARRDRSAGRGRARTGSGLHPRSLVAAAHARAVLPVVLGMLAWPLNWPLPVAVMGLAVKASWQWRCEPWPPTAAPARPTRCAVYMRTTLEGQNEPKNVA